MKKLFTLLLSIISLGVYAQSGSINPTAIRSRVADSTTVMYPTGWGVLYYNAQSNKWRLCNGSGVCKDIGSGSGGGVFNVTTRNNLPPDVRTTSFTLAAADTSQMIVLDNSADLVITLDDFSAVNRGLQFAFYRKAGTDTVYFADGGETLEALSLGVTEGSYAYLYYNPDDNEFYLASGGGSGGGGGGGTVTSVSGTTNRITSTGGTTPVIDISSTFEALLGKVAQRIDQNNASTTSAQLATTISDETGTGSLVYSNSPALTTPNIGSATGSVSGNAGTATALATGRTISITGDVAYTSPSFDGTGNVTAAGTLATVNSNVGSFGSATAASIFTVNAKGLITAASSTTITPAVGSITGLGTGVATALGVNIGSAGAPVLFNGAGGTPASLTLTNATGLPISGITGLGTGVGTFLATPSWTNFNTMITGTAPFWSLASGGTLTGNNNLAGAFSVGLGASPSAKFHVVGLGTTTGELVRFASSTPTTRLSMLDNGQTSWVGSVSGASAIGRSDDITVTATANSQTQTGWDYNFNNVDGAFTPLIRNVAQWRVNGSSTPILLLQPNQISTNAISLLALTIAGDMTVRNTSGALYLRGGSGSTTGLKFGPSFSSTTNNNVAFNFTAATHNIITGPGITRSFFGFQDDNTVTSADGNTVTYTHKNIVPVISTGTSTTTVIGEEYNPTITTSGTLIHYAKLYKSGNVGIADNTPSEKLSVAGNIKTRHLIGQSTAPSVSAGAGAGTGPSATLSNATDLSGLINLTTGTSPSIGATVLTVTFNAAYGQAPNIVLFPANANAALLSGVTMVYATSSTTTFLLTSGATGLTAASDYKWFYQVIQ